ncbi:MAG: hypothetical protein MUF52_15295 [Syntrophobacteraceae bacterium]|nr:hypothetical protein [Syntrophobacteraceae bacterium]
MTARPPERVGEYNQDQHSTVRSVLDVLSRLSGEERVSLGASMEPYLEFRRRVSVFFDGFFRPSCQDLCFSTGLSGCCGFESIITFFADHVINLMGSSPGQVQALTARIQSPNSSRRCVYLGPEGCLWSLPPVSCAMFLCARVKEIVFQARPEAQPFWAELLQREKDFTLPDKPVLFDGLEAFFIERGSDSSHLFYHRSPGLLRIKSKAGLCRGGKPAGARGVRLS